MEWIDCLVPLPPPGGYNSKEFDVMEDISHIHVKDELIGNNWLLYYATKILDAKNVWPNVTKAVVQLAHLYAHQNADLLQVLHDNEK